MNRYFRIPWATSGDKTAIPEGTQPDGSVSYQTGYGPDYQAEQGVDPDAKNIERDKMNQVLFDVTTALAEYQTFGRPDYITSAQNNGTPYPYAKYAQVKWTDGKVYESLVDTNTADPTDPTKWKEATAFVLVDNIATLAEAQAGVANDKVMTPLRVSQAVPSASEAVAGRARLATQVQVDAGVDDSAMVTSKKLRNGVQFTSAQNGGLKLPSWLGGFVINWGRGSPQTWTFTYAYASWNVPAAVLSTMGSTGANTYCQCSTTLTQITVGSGYDASRPVAWICIGK